MLKYPDLEKNDPQIASWIKKEELRQIDGLEMIPSENYVSPSVLEAMGSILTNKYSEGYPRKRYYGGNDNIDAIEEIAKERAKKLFKVPYVNVQPYSGSPANLAVYLATVNPGDVIMGLDLTHGGHLTHGWKVSATGIFYKSISYHVNSSDGRIDFNELEKLATAYKPKLIWVGATAYVYQFPFKQLSLIADKVGAYLAADIAHVAGLVIAGVHVSPEKFVHIITTTTHKTLRGPRGAMIMVTDKGIKKDPKLAEKIDKAVFPGLQGGPHDQTTAAIAVALKEAGKPSFKKYGTQIVKNANALAGELIKNGFKLIGNGTENHMILVDLIPKLGAGGGFFAQYALDTAGITVNKNTIAGEPFSPFYPSGIRLGTPALTTRGMKEKDMKQIAQWIKSTIDCIKNNRMPEDKEERKKLLEVFKKNVNKNTTLKIIRSEVKKFAGSFPYFAW